MVQLTFASQLLVLRCRCQNQGVFLPLSRSQSTSCLQTFKGSQPAETYSTHDAVLHDPPRGGPCHHTPRHVILPTRRRRSHGGSRPALRPPFPQLPSLQPRPWPCGAAVDGSFLCGGGQGGVSGPGRSRAEERGRCHGGAGTHLYTLQAASGWDGGRSLPC